MKKFSTSFNGYSKLEVNKFVNEVTSEYESMLNKLKLYDSKLTELQDELAKYKNLENTLNKAIRYAEDDSNNIKNLIYHSTSSVSEFSFLSRSSVILP